jgi:hypothetical protein
MKKESKEADQGHPKDGRKSLCHKAGNASAVCALRHHFIVARIQRFF